MYQQSEKNLLNSNISSTCVRNMVNFGSLAAEIGSGIWGTPANFNGFHMFALLLHWPRSPETDQTLHDVWLSPGLVHYMYIFGGSCPLTEICQVQNSLFVQVLCSHILACSVTARHSSSRYQSNLVAWYTEWNYGTFAVGATYIWLGGHHIGHQPTF